MTGALVSLALPLLALLTTSCAAPRGGSNPDPDATSPVILISIDTLSAKHLGCYGYRRETSPNIDAFAEESVLFERLINTGGGTLPVHMSLFTSLHPETHGVLIDEERTGRLSPRRTTLAESLKNEGYATAGFADGGWMRGRFGFRQGFDVYEGTAGHLEKKLPRAYSWLDSHHADPFFLFLHTYDVHSKSDDLPYSSPDGFGELCASRLLRSWRHRIEFEGFDVSSALSTADLEYLVALYDGGIAYVDRKIGELFERLKELGVYDRSLIVFTSDHGEEFLEHGLLLHRQNHEEVAHVPLIVKLPRGRFAGRRIPSLAATVDVMPTILDVLGIEPPEEIQGVSLLPAITGEGAPRRAVHVWGRGSWQRPKLTTARWSMLVDKETGEPEMLFDLTQDPHEQADVLDRYPEVARKLSETLSRLEERDREARRSFEIDDVGEETSVDLDAESVERLRALGYL